MNVGIFSFARRHNRAYEKCGSSIIRAKWMWENWPDAEEYVEGKKYDVVIFQKVWWPEMLKIHTGIKILDLCDPEWLQSRWPIVEIAHQVDAIVVSSKGLRDALQKIIPEKVCPIVWIDDRIDSKFAGDFKKKHSGNAKRVAWYGYRHNGNQAIPQVLPTLKRLGLELHIICENRLEFAGFENMVTYSEFNWNTLAYELMSCDIVLNPPVMSPYAQYKSLNKTYLAWAFGMPVAHNGDELRAFLTEESRIKEGERVSELVKKEYNTTKSVEEYKNLITKLCQKKGITLS